MNLTVGINTALNVVQKVEKLVKSDFFRLFNHKNQTAQQLFDKNYSKLHEDSKKWLEETSKNCTIVAVLIATVAFTAAYTVPGGIKAVVCQSFSPNPSLWFSPWLM